MTLPLHSNNGGLGFNYGAELPLFDYYDIATYKFELIKAYQAWVLEPEYSSFMEFIQLSAQFDSDNSYPSIEKPVNCRSKKQNGLISMLGIRLSRVICRLQMQYTEMLSVVSVVKNNVEYGGMSR